MKNKTKYVILSSIFLVIFAGGAAGHVIVTKEIVERQTIKEDFRGAGAQTFTEGRRFQPRQYIKVISEKGREQSD
ncbi:hypothetical protein [Salipaludibacillus aurantiacus]|uniref:Uncharacterized protein n=1 Tax=Salipaludibacillus aurantiacus TaxID=1601833 RepID=A0A1H9RFK6_9BACI|nr:hypothetical protein [Salipaludibacillus aurantiacus]SER71454.1 hypothetical protein SAMN05518684_103125 [Salipaludibacillus aurantiacus]